MHESIRSGDAASYKQKIMKTLIIVLLLAIFTVSVIAQSKSALNQEQLNLALAKSKHMQTTGLVISAIGVTVFGTGVILLVNSPMECERLSGNLYGRCHVTKWRGGKVLLAGFGITAVGIPVLLIGVVRKQSIEIDLVKFKGSASVNGIGLKMRF